MNIRSKYSFLQNTLLWVTAFVLSIIIPYQSQCAECEPSKCIDEGLALVAKGLLNKAISKFKIACSANLNSGCLNLGAVQLGQGENKAARRTFEEVCKKEKSLCLSLAALEFREGNKAKAKELYEETCNVGNAQACTDAAGFYSSNTDKMNYFRKGCNGNSGEGCNNLGFLLEKTDLNQSEVLFKKSCDLNYADGCNNLGHLYFRKNDIKAATPLFERGCTLGHSDACTSLRKLR